MPEGRQAALRNRGQPGTDSAEPMAPPKPKDSKASAGSGRSSWELGTKAPGDPHGGCMSRNGGPSPAPLHTLNAQSHPFQPTAATSRGTPEAHACAMALPEGAGKGGCEKPSVVTLGCCRVEEDLKKSNPVCSSHPLTQYISAVPCVRHAELRWLRRGRGKRGETRACGNLSGPEPAQAPQQPPCCTQGKAAAASLLCPRGCSFPGWSSCGRQRMPSCLQGPGQGASSGSRHSDKGPTARIATHLAQGWLQR